MEAQVAFCFLYCRLRVLCAEAGGSCAFACAFSRRLALYSAHYADLPFGKLTLILLVDLDVAIHFTVLT
jgi:hypothetical protein